MGNNAGGGKRTEFSLDFLHFTWWNILQFLSMKYLWGSFKVKNVNFKHLGKMTSLGPVKEEYQMGRGLREGGAQVIGLARSWPLYPLNWNVSVPRG